MTYSPAETDLLLDVMVGGIRSVLRMVGYDTVYALDRDVEADEAVLEIARGEDRVLITRDTDLASRCERSVLLSAKEADVQLAELVRAGFVLELEEPTRCSRCNGELAQVDGGEIPDDGPDPAEEPVWRCLDCGQPYWRGSHWADVETRLDKIAEET